MPQPLDSTTAAISGSGIGLWGRWMAHRVNRRSPGEISLDGRKVRYTRGRPFLTMYHEIFEQESYRFTGGNPAGRILDIGANIGLATIYFKHLLPRATVVAVEANPELCTILRQNIASQELSGVEVLAKAVSPHPGVVRFQCDSGLSGRIADDGTASSTVEVEAVTVSSLVTDDIELVKLDVEGAENEILTKDNAWLSRVPRIFFEHHQRAGEPDTLPEILVDLTRRGFTHLTAPATELRPGFGGKHGYPPFVRQQNVWAWKKE